MPGMPQPVVRVSPIEVRLLHSGKEGLRFCFDPAQIKGFAELEGGGLELFLAGYDQPFEIMGTYDGFASKCGVEPQIYQEGEDGG